jgi:hypothetical protein
VHFTVLPGSVDKNRHRIGRALEAMATVTLWRTAQTVDLRGLASGLANAAFLAVVTDRVSERCYGDGYRG